LTTNAHTCLKQRFGVFNLLLVSVDIFTTHLNVVRKCCKFLNVITSALHCLHNNTCFLSHNITTNFYTRHVQSQVAIYLSRKSSGNQNRIIFCRLKPYQERKAPTAYVTMTYTYKKTPQQIATYSTNRFTHEACQRITKYRV